MQSIRGGLLLKTAFICGLAAALPIAASAAKIIMCSTCDPTVIPLTQTNGALSDLQPNGSETVTDEFLNLTGTILDNIEYSTTINTGLSASMLATDQDFTCQAPNGFFLSCAVLYDSATGALVYDYFGTNPPDWQDLPLAVVFEDLVGGGFGNTGIPEGGLFEVQLQGWTSNLTDPDTGQQLYSGLPTLSGAFNVPEPSAALILMTELLLLGGVLALLGRRLKLKQRFEL